MTEMETQQSAASNELTLHRFYRELRGLNEEKRKAIRDAGFTLKEGPFSDDECERIKSNFERFVRKHGLENDEEAKNMLLGFYGKPLSERLRLKKKHIRKLASENEFVFKLAKGLNDRTLHSVYEKARRYLSTLRKASALTSDERGQVLEMSRAFNKKWCLVAQAMDCHPYIFSDFLGRKIDENGQPIKQGSFTQEEDTKLVKAIIQETGIANIKDAFFVRIPWCKVRKHIHSRNTIQCRERWLTLSNKIEEYVEPILLNIVTYTDFDSAKLIYIMYKKRKDWDSMLNIDWDFLKNLFEHVGALHVIMRWWMRLVSLVPENDSKSFKQIVKWLYKYKFDELITDEEKEKIKRFYSEEMY